VGVYPEINGSPVTSDVALLTILLQPLAKISRTPVLGFITDDDGLNSCAQCDSTRTAAVRRTKVLALPVQPMQEERA
jgi:hypothetical protein